MPGYESQIRPDDPADYLSLMRRFERAKWIPPMPKEIPDVSAAVADMFYTLVGQWRLDQLSRAVGKTVEDFNEDEFYRVADTLRPPELSLGERSVLIALARSLRKE
jgi:hypothetical protein